MKHPFLKRMAALLLTLPLTLGLLPVFAADDNGLTFTAQTHYITAKDLTAMPNTFEAVLRLPASQTGRSGVIMGNFSPGAPCVNFEISDHGKPRLYLYNGSQLNDVTFSSVNVCTGEWLHLALVRDKDAGAFHCYVNGEPVQTVTATVHSDPQTDNVLALGGDLRGGNEQYFKGALSRVALYEDARTAEQIRRDVSTVDLDGMIVGYDLTGLPADPVRIADVSGNGLHAVIPGQELEGFAFSADARYVGDHPLEAMPNTFEATLSVPKTQTGRAGIIAGNYGRGLCTNFEIADAGVPRLYLMGDGGGVNDIRFDQVHVNTGKPVHLTLVRDVAAGCFRCYIDGELVQTVATRPVTDISHQHYPIVLGGDLRLGNAMSFKGRLQNVALYADVRTDEEIAADCAAPGTDRDDLLFCVDLSETEADAKTINDLSGNNNHLKRQAVSSTVWLAEEPPLEDYAYSFAVLGDTQVLNEFYPQKFAALYDWVVDNAAAKKMAYVIGLGDITNSNTADEWARARENVLKLKDVVPFSLVRGNHDGSDMFNRTFTLDDYTDAVTGYNGKMENTWRELTVGELQYLILTLDYGPSDAVMNWAGEVIDAHPDHQVIITTHAYLFNDGTTLDQTDICPPATTGGHNNGDAMWEKFVSKHPNIVLVLCGHDPSDYVVTAQTPGEAGNIVTQMLIDPQGTDSANKGVALVAMLHFSQDGRSLQVTYYSVDRGMWYLPENQFTVQLAHAGAPSEPPAVAWGDINEDGAVNAADALLALQHSVKLISLTGDRATAADVSGDGTINAADALLILQKSVKLIDLFPVEA